MNACVEQPCRSEVLLTTCEELNLPPKEAKQACAVLNSCTCTGVRITTGPDRYPTHEFLWAKGNPQPPTHVQVLTALSGARVACLQGLDQTAHDLVFGVDIDDLHAETTRQLADLSATSAQTGSAPPLGFSFTDKAKLHDVTNRNWSVIVVRPDPSGPEVRAGFLSGKQVAVAATAWQVPDPQVVRTLRTQYQLLDYAKKAYSEVRRFNKGIKFRMAGFPLILTDQTAASAGYSGQRALARESKWDPSAVADILHNIGTCIWNELSRHWKEAPKLRAALLAALHAKNPAEMLMGTSAFNLLAQTVNQAVDLHVDPNDCGPCVILWFHSGDGTLEGGEFCLQTLGLRFVPGDCTILLLHSASLLHGTAPYIQPPDSTACRMGSAIFLRWQDVVALTCLQYDAAVNNTTLSVRQFELDRALAATAAKAAVKKKAAADRAKRIESGRESRQLAIAEAYDNTVPPPNPPVPHLLQGDQGFTLWKAWTTKN